MRKLKKIDILIYFSSFVSLILIVLLLSSSSSISYQIEDETIQKVDNNDISFRFDNLDKHIDLEKSKKIKTNKIKLATKNLEMSLTNLKTLKTAPADEDIIEYSVKAKMTESVIYHTVRRGECLWSISKKYNISMNRIAEINRISNPNILRVGRRLKIYPDSSYNSKQVLDSKIVNRTQINYLRKRHIKFKWPLRGRLTSGFGVRRSPYNNKMEFHTGVDIAAPVGRKFASAEDGKVIFVGRKGGYGLVIIIEHSNGYTTLYAHCLIGLVRKGQYVRKGQIIGKIGESGITTGPHLHFEIRKNNFAIDPTTLINNRQLFY